MKQSALQRIQRIMKFNYNRGLNSERVNAVYRKIIKQKLEGSNQLSFFIINASHLVKILLILAQCK